MSLGAPDSATLIVTGVAWLLMVVALAVDLAGKWRRSWPGFWLLAPSPQLGVAWLSSFADARHWPYTQQQRLSDVELVTLIVVFACIVMALAVRARSRSGRRVT